MKVTDILLLACLALFAYADPQKHSSSSQGNASSLVTWTLSLSDLIHPFIGLAIQIISIGMVFPKDYALFIALPAIWSAKKAWAMEASCIGNNFELSNLDGSNGFVINGIGEGDRAGFSVSSAGDVNGDGIDDIIVGANRADPDGRTDAGQAYVVFGTTTSLSAALELSSLDGSNGFVINGIGEGDRAGVSVSSAGDVNGDSIDDIIVGADSADPDGRIFAGQAYVVFGKATGWSAALELSSLDGSNGFVINGIDSRDLAGTSVSSAGDVNGDRIDDIIVGAFFADPDRKTNAGQAYVVFGKATGWSAAIELSSLDGSNGFMINGIDPDDYAGFSVSSAGDVNGDSIDDIIVGANSADPDGRTIAGEAYIVFGKATGWSAALELLSLDGSNGFVINGISDEDQAGFSVSSAGDVNGDGIDDIIVGANKADPDGRFNAGQAYVVFGKAIAEFELSSLDGSNGFVLNGIDDRDFAGRSVSSAGDVNGDGIDDIIVGASSADPDGRNSAGEAYVVFGKATGWSAAFELSSMDGSNGFVLNGIDDGDDAGHSVSSAGGVNGDGIDDIIVGAFLADQDGRFTAGEAYVVFVCHSLTNDNKCWGSDIPIFGVIFWLICKLFGKL